MIKAKHDGQYKQVGFIKVRQPDGTYKDVEKKYGKINGGEYGLVFEKGFTREVEGALPLTLNGIGKQLKDYSIYGNTFQSDGVTPDTPQEVVGCGDKTGNLVNISTENWRFYNANTTIDVVDNKITINGSGFIYTIVPVTANTNYTFQYVCESYTKKNLAAIFGVKNGVMNSSDPIIANAPSGKTFNSEERTEVALLFYSSDSSEVGISVYSNIQLNSGSTPLPYEPYGYKISVESRGKNLFPLDSTKLHVGRIENDGTIGYEIGTITVDTNSVTYQANTTWRGFYTDYITVVGNDKLTFSPNRSSAISIALACYDKDNRFLGKATSTSSANSKTFTLINDTTKVRVNITSSDTQYTITNPMLETGSTATEYSPYIEPITTPIYLDSPLYKIGDYADNRGKTEEIRVIKELVLTGEEAWSYITDGKHWTPVTMYQKSGLMCICSHYEAVANGSGSLLVANGQVGFYSSSADRLIFCNTNYTTTEDWKSYLAAQYAAGTPVKVYYVLAEPEVTSVEPVEIPTLNGSTVIDVDTEVKPSNVYIKYKSKT